jgi:tRNA nucleotidyltransferase (CCA-adding enzyme)
LSLVRAIGQRCKAPKDCQELALLVCQYHTHGHRALELKASTLFELLNKTDAIRRPQRFVEFVAACTMDARGRAGLEHNPYPQAQYLLAAADTARSVSVQPLMAQGLQGEELGKALNALRLKSIELFLHDQRQGHAAPPARTDK